MKHRIAQLALVVKDYDEALDFYLNKLHFTLKEDTVISPEKRWVVISPAGNMEGGSHLLLVKASNDVQSRSIGNQTGGRVFLFLYTDDIHLDFQNLTNHQVTIVRPITEFEYGTVLVFADLYGNLWDLIQPK